MKTTILSTALLLCAQLCFAQFRACTYTPGNSQLNDVYFMNATTGIVVGDDGTILRTTDGGDFWSRVLLDSAITFLKVKFFDEKVGIALGSHLYKTTDSGLTWSPLDVPNTKFFDIEILNATTCLITGVPTALLKSDDQGSSWEVLVDENIRNVNFSEYDFGLLSFVDEQLGYTIPNSFSLHPRIFKTTDGGISWDTIYREIVHNENYEISTIEAFSFVDENTGFKGGWYNPLLLKTTDGGLRWDGLWADDPGAYYISVNDFHIEADQPGAYYACGSHNKIVKSTDQGENWVPMEIETDERVHFYGIYFINDTLGWAVGSRGNIFTTRGIDHSAGNTELRIFPNPTSGKLVIYRPGCDKISNCTLTDQSGRLVRRIEAKGIEIDISDLPAGMYFLEVVTEEGTVVEKIIKH